MPILTVEEKNILFEKIRPELQTRGGIGDNYNIKVKVKVSHSLIAVGAAGVRVPLYLGHS